MLIVLIGMALLLRIAATFLLPLIPDEAYYWMYAQNPSLSYFDHPPIIAWMVMLGTAVLGDNEAGVRIVGALLMVGASGLMYLFARMWYGRTAAAMAAVLLHVLPIYFGMGLMATPDSPMIFFWLLCLWGVSVALKKRRAWGWYVAGAGLGLAMLTKYTGVFLAVGAVAAVVVHRPWRRELLSPHPYLAVLLALLLFSPVLVWNAQHEWISFRFQITERYDDEPARWKNPVYFVGHQLAMATPVVLAAGGWLAWQVARRRVRLRPRWVMALCFSVPLLGVVAVKSLTDQTLFHWTAPVYLALLPAVCRMGLVQGRGAKREEAKGRREARGVSSVACGFADDPAKAQAWDPDKSSSRLSSRLGAFAVCGPLVDGLRVTAYICLGVIIGGGIFLLAGQPGRVLVQAFGPWRQIAAAVHEQADQVENETGHQPLVIARGRYALASSIAFYRHRLDPALPVEDLTTGSRFLTNDFSGYRYWIDREEWVGRDCLYLSTRDDRERLLEYFEQVTLLPDPRLRQDRNYRLYLGRSLR